MLLSINRLPMISRLPRETVSLSETGHTGYGKENIARHRRRRALSPHSLLLHPISNWRATRCAGDKRLMTLEKYFRTGSQWKLCQI
jgi:hypothetical protein